MPRQPAKPQQTSLYIYIALFALALLPHLQTASFAFINYDDPDYVTHNPHVQQGLTPDSVTWALTSGDAANWLPVTRLSHILDVQFFGLDAGAHHLTSVAIHALATLLLFAFLHLAFLHLATGARWPAAFVAITFATHPLHVESVAWVSERKAYRLRPSNIQNFRILHSEN